MTTSDRPPVQRVNYSVNRRMLVSEDGSMPCVQAYVWWQAVGEMTREWGVVITDEPGAWQEAHCIGFNKVVELCGGTVKP